MDLLQSPPTRRLRILGTRGVPAAHGGFETFAEQLALYLVGHGWQVTVYCQEEGAGPVVEDTWHGVHRVRMPVAGAGAAGTVLFDWRSTLHASRSPGLVLTLGYNTALFCALYRIKGLRNVINMDGIEWRRQKWGTVAKMWFWLNDWAGCVLGNHLVADHPEIQRHLNTRVRAGKISTIPYGADAVLAADASLLASHGLEPGGYAVLIARAEPENSILEVVRAWSRQPRGMRLVVLGKYESGHAYQQAVMAAASPEVLFVGAIYDKAVVQALRFYARFYVHGHQVGGTNPSLVESLGAGNAILAHDNPYNRWVAGAAAVYFSNEDDCADKICALQADVGLTARLQAASRLRHQEQFTCERVLGDYEALLAQWLDAPAGPRALSLGGKVQTVESLDGAVVPARPSVLVLGGTGFIGRALIKQLLRDGLSVRALVRDTGGQAALLASQGVELVQGDITQAAALAAALEDIQHVYHLARGHGSSWEDHLRHDVEPTARLAELCCVRGITLYYTSSIAIYDGGHAGALIAESTPPSAAAMRISSYARAKVVSERLLAELHRERGLRVVVFRPGIVIGEGGSPFHPGVGAWPSPSVCQPWGGGHQPLPFVLVDDCADAMVRALHVPGIAGLSFNLVGDPCLSGHAYLNALEHAAGIQVRRMSMPTWWLFSRSAVKWGMQTLTRAPERRMPSYSYIDGLSCRASYRADLAKQRLGWKPAADSATLIERGIAPAVKQ